MFEDVEKELVQRVTGWENTVYVDVEKEESIEGESTVLLTTEQQMLDIKGHEGDYELWQVDYDMEKLQRSKVRNPTLNTELVKTDCMTFQGSKPTVRNPSFQN
ncbi:Hypothetical predicted protein [Octopus vulgaris]|uniref:Uncharacterized protein n=1 Tax=Octopus vulgaris TaxID=6645 RepID=A0AA36EXX6_OCTVU|nr:Hypothetical predicted protein [Octopus vulgaris]